MVMSTLIAKIASIVFVCVGLAGLFNKKLYLQVGNDMFKNAGLTLVYVFIEMVLSFFVVAYHNIWTGWPVIITVLGWMGLLEGALIIVFPKFVKNFSMPIFKGGFGKIMPYIALALGLVIGYFGFLI